MSNWYERSTCRLCDAALPAERVLDLGATPLANALENADHVSGPDYPLFLKQCSVCGHCQLPVVVDPKLLFPESYPYASSTGESFRAHLRDMAQDLSETLSPDAFVVEIGSNDGYLLSEFTRQGYRVFGVDPAAQLAREATKRGALTLPEFFTPDIAASICHACGPAELVVANNVFAHADNLHEIVEGVKVLLAPEGRFVFEVGYLPDVLRTNNFGTVYHEHLSYHTLRPLALFLAKRGLRVSLVERVNTQGGSIRCHVKRIPGDVISADVRLTGEYADELGGGLADWQLRVNAARTRLREQLIWRKSQGKTIAAYGCSAKSTTLLHVAGIGRETIDFICDDNPLKQGRFSPGKHLPVVPGSWLEEKQPDYCVSLAGNFSEAFRTAHPGYRGEWIEPVLT